MAIDPSHARTDKLPPHYDIKIIILRIDMEVIHFHHQVMLSESIFFPWLIVMWMMAVYMSVLIFNIQTLNGRKKIGQIYLPKNGWSRPCIPEEITPCF